MQNGPVLPSEGSFFSSRGFHSGITDQRQELYLQPRIEVLSGPGDSSSNILAIFFSYRCDGGCRFFRLPWPGHLLVIRRSMTILKRPCSWDQKPDPVTVMQDMTQVGLKAGHRAQLAVDKRIPVLRWHPQTRQQRSQGASIREGDCTLAKLGCRRSPPYEPNPVPTRRPRSCQPPYPPATSGNIPISSRGPAPSPSNGTSVDKKNLHFFRGSFN